MHLQSLQSPSLYFGSPGFALRPPDIQSVMDIGNLLNTKSERPAPSRSPSSPGSSLNHHFAQAHLAPGGYHSHHSSTSDLSFDTRSPIYPRSMAQVSPQPLQRPPQPSPAYPDTFPYQPQPGLSEPSPSTTQLPYDPIADRKAGMQGQPGQSPLVGQTSTQSGEGSGELPKAFACSTCQKGFARRSDLVRHERIHSGVRPHVCTHPGCGKQFIQRSALTVHERVHTREKPHLCEKCGKPFSDSSSLARHRRIHSGTRPYQCPYQDCQKTFTRRTTLTRHQNHHTGTVEESAAARAASLASRANQQVLDKPEQPSENDQQSDASSAASYNPYMSQMQAGGMPRSTPYQTQPGPAAYYHQGPSPAQQGGYPPPRMPQGQPQPDNHPERYAHPTPPQANMPWAQPGVPQHHMQPVPKMEGSQPTQQQPHPNQAYAYQQPPHGYYQGGY